VSAYGYRRPTTPNIARWAQNAARFTRAYCTSPRSLRSFASTFTGQYPSSVIWGGDNTFPGLEDANATLAEELRARGYATAAFNNADYFSRTAGFYQGFEERHEGHTFKDEAEPAVRDALAWLRQRAAEPRPFFGWLHLMEPHDGYRDLTQPQEFGHSDPDRYDEEIARADMFAGRVLALLDEIAAHRLPREPANLPNRTRVQFGNVLELLGWELPRTQYHVGEAVQATVVYRVMSRTAAPAWTAIYFEREDRRPFWNFFNMLHYPINGRYLTTQWIPGEILRDDMARRIDPEVPPGRYRMRFAVERDPANPANRYRPSQRSLPDGSFELGVIEILP
jgi:hypothetical protein